MTTCSGNTTENSTDGSTINLNILDLGVRFLTLQTQKLFLAHYFGIEKIDGMSISDAGLFLFLYIFVPRIFTVNWLNSFRWLVGLDKFVRE